MALRIATVTNAIAALSVAGVTICDIDEIPAEGTSRGALVIPNPEKFVTGFSAVRDSFGGASAKMTVKYTLNYRFLYKQVGEGRVGLFDLFDGMVDTAFLFIDAVLAVATVAGCEDMTLQEVPAFGPVTDPVGTLFFGCDFALQVTEYVN